MFPESRVILLNLRLSAHHLAPKGFCVRSKAGKEAAAGALTNACLIFFVSPMQLSCAARKCNDSFAQ